MLDAGLARLRDETKRAKREDFEKDVKLFEALHETRTDLPETTVYHILSQVVGRERASAVGDFKEHVHGLRTRAEAASIQAGSPSRGSGR